MSGMHMLLMLHQLSTTIGTGSLSTTSLLRGTPPIERHCTGSPRMKKVAMLPHKAGMLGTGYPATSMLSQSTETTMVADQRSPCMIPICMLINAGMLPDIQTHTTMLMHLRDPSQTTGGMTEIIDSCRPGGVLEQPGLKEVRWISAGTPCTQRAGMTGSTASCLLGTSRGIKHPGWLMSMRNLLPGPTEVANILLPGMTGTLLAQRQGVLKCSDTCVFACCVSLAPVLNALQQQVCIAQLCLHPYLWFICNWPKLCHSLTESLPWQPLHLVCRDSCPVLNVSLACRYADQSDPGLSRARSPYAPRQPRPMSSGRRSYPSGRSPGSRGPSPIRDTRRLSTLLVSPADVYHSHQLICNQFVMS